MNARDLQYRLVKNLRQQGWRAYAEYSVDNPEKWNGRGRCDVGAFTPNGLSVGIEIKNNVADLHSGYGLNQELFNIGYVMCNKKILEQTIGYLYLCNMQRTGIIAVEFNDDQYSIEYVKPAIICKKGEYPLQDYSLYNALVREGDE